MIVIEIHGLGKPQAAAVARQVCAIFFETKFAPDILVEPFPTSVGNIDQVCSPYLRVVALPEYLTEICDLLDGLIPRLPIQPVPSVFHEKPLVAPILPKPEVHTSIYQEDAPACDVCGSITVRNGNCYKCTNCGASLGCS